MRKKIIFFINIVIAIALMYSCDAGGGSGADNSQLCKISFAAYSEDGRVNNRLVSVTNADPLDGATYQYKATPLWTSDFGSVQGTTNGWVDYEPGDSLGYFAVGPWEFEVQILSYSGHQVYHGTIQTYANPGAASVTIEVAKVSDGVGTLSITAYTHTAVADDILDVSYGLVSDLQMLDAIETLTVNNPAHDYVANKSTFTKSITQIPAGVYWVTLTYKTGPLTRVGGVTTCVEIVPGETSSISGWIETNVWQSMSISVGDVPMFGISLSAAGAATSVDSGADLVFTCTKTAGSTDIKDYMWFVDGVRQNGQTNSTFTFNRTYDENADNENYYRVNCIAGDVSDPQLCASAIWYIVVKDN